MEKNLLHIIKSLFKIKKQAQSGEPEPNSAVMDIIRHRLQAHMFQQKPYLNPHYKLKDLSEDLQIPLHQLSAYLNKRLRMHFNEYLNLFRIEYCKELIQKEPPGRISLKEIGSKCGFNNRNTFRMAFKKFTGKTPTEYIRKHY